MDRPAPWKWVIERASKKASTGLVVILFLLSLIASNGPEWIKVLKKEKSEPPVLGSEITQLELPEASPDNLNNSGCRSLVPLEEYNLEIEYERIKKRGDFYYPTGSGNSWEGTVWVKKFLKPDFKKIFIEYEITLEENHEKPPTFIWTVSRMINERERQHIGKIWLPEFSESNGVNIPQLAGFARTLDFDQGTLEREESLELPDPVKEGKLDSLTIERTGVSGNEMMINFTYDYTSNRTGTAMSFPFIKKFIFPFSNLASSGEQLDFGLGTFVNHSLRIVSLEVCY